jgi:hypothetical protein
VRYSRIATKYTAVVALTLPLAAAHDFNNLWIHPTGNCNRWHNYKVMVLCNTESLSWEKMEATSKAPSLQCKQYQRVITLTPYIAAEIGTELEEKY